MLSQSELLQWVLGELEDATSALQHLDTTHPQDKGEFARILRDRVQPALNGAANECSDGPGWDVG